MIERVVVMPGPGTVIRYGGIVIWADPSASPALVSFLTQSARNLAASTRGGRQIADHIAEVLANRDPEPGVAFVVMGPSDHGWASLMHGPVQAWDGAQWLSPRPSPGWLQAILTPQPSVTVGRAGTPMPTLHPDSMLDFEAGVVPGAGFVLVPTPDRRLRTGRPADTGAAGAAEAAQAPAQAIPAAPAADEDEATELLSTAGVAPAAQPVAAAGVALAAQPDATAGVAPAAQPDAAAGVAPAAETDDTPGEAPATQVLPALGGARAAGPLAAGAGAAPESQPPPQGEPSPGLPPAVAGPGTLGSIDLRAVGAVPATPLPIGVGPDKPVAGAAMVAGVLCPRGHFNRPGTTACVRCSMAIPPGSADNVSGSRPPLGVLVADDGAVYRLDAGYLVGSDPVHDPTVSGGLARPLELPGDNVVASHAEIRLHGWDVTVIDRGSPGGTHLFEPGAGEWTRVKPFEQRRLRPGTHVAFAQRIVTFAAPWIAEDTPR